MTQKSAESTALCHKQKKYWKENTNKNWRISDVMRSIEKACVEWVVREEKESTLGKICAEGRDLSGSEGEREL